MADLGGGAVSYERGTPAVRVRLPVRVGGLESSLEGDPANLHAPCLGLRVYGLWFRV